MLKQQKKNKAQTVIRKAKLGTAVLNDPLRGYERQARV